MSHDVPVMSLENVPPALGQAGTSVGQKYLEKPNENENVPPMSLVVPVFVPDYKRGIQKMTIEQMRKNLEAAGYWFGADEDGEWVWGPEDHESKVYLSESSAVHACYLQTDGGKRDPNARP